MINAMYSVLSKAFELTLLKVSDSVNEILLWQLSYMLFCFTTIVPDMQVEFDIGWVFIALIILLIAFNGLIFLIALVITIKLHCKRFMNKRLLKKRA